MDRRAPVLPFNVETSSQEPVPFYCYGIAIQIDDGEMLRHAAQKADKADAPTADPFE
jgi:hypothetical protein